LNFWDKLGALDRRWIYLLMALSVIFPLIVPMSFKISITPEARQLFEAVDALPDSSVVMLTFDYYPSTVAETEPMATAARTGDPHYRQRIQQGLWSRFRQSRI
jgi:hypothetical protein